MTISTADLSVELLLEARKVFERHGLTVPNGGAPMVMAVSALMRVAYSIGLAGDPKLEALMIIVLENNATITAVSDGKEFDLG